MTREQVACDASNPDQWCDGLVRHIWFEPFTDTKWLCHKHYKEWEAAHESKQTQGNGR